MPSDAISVLLVEDSPSDADLLEATLRQMAGEQFEFTWVESMADAVAELRRRSFDVMLLDLSLPDSAGSETFRRAREAAPGLPVVVLTGSSDERLGLEAVHEGVQDYLVKGQTDARQVARAIRYAIERKRAELALNQQREWLRVTLTSIGDAVLATGNDGRITFLNPVAARLTGWDAGEALGRPVQEVFRIVNERTGSPGDDIVARVLREGRVVALANDTALLTRDGRHVPIEDSAAPIRDAAGDVEGAVLVFHDVTERRRAQEALRHSDERLSLALRAARDGVWDWDVETGAVFYSPRWKEMLGYSEAEIEPTVAAWEALLHPDDRARFRDHLDPVLRGECEYEIEFRLRHKDGRYLDILSRGVCVRQDGRVVRIVGTHFDLTERKQAEETIRHYNAILEARTRMLRAALTCDTERELGEACLALAEELTGSKLGFVAEIGPQGLAHTISISDPGWEACRIRGAGELSKTTGLKIHGLYGRVLLDGKAFYTNDPDVHPDRIGVPEGHPRLTAFLGVPLRQDGTVIGMIGVANREGGYRPPDVEALEDLGVTFVQALMRQRAERTVRASEERLRQAQKLESIGVLAGGMAHDFNNLLVGVVGNASLAEDLLPPGSPVADILNRILKAGEQASHLTRQMLAYAGKGRFVLEPVDVSELVRETGGLIRSSISKKVSLILELGDAPPVESDPGQMQQVFMNLALNAAEAIDDVAGVVTVSTGEAVLDAAAAARLEGWTIEPGRYVFLEVRDTGCGMDAATRARIFDPFFSTKFLGRGLGLAATAGIVRAQKGAIDVTTAPGAGSTFRVLLPAMNREISVLPRKVAPKEHLRGYGTILIVDDELFVREVAKSCLERQGYDVLVADNGPAAIDAVRAHPIPIRLTVLDLSMPGMPTEVVLRRLRELDPDMRVVLSSGYSESEVLHHFEGLPVSGFIQKPYTSDQLARALKSALEGEL